MLLVAGPAGQGKTTVLRQAHAMTEQLHSAYVDVAGQDLDSSTRILTELVFQLGLRHRKVSQLRFPRFLLGQLAVQLPLPDNAPLAAREEMLRLLGGLKHFRIAPDVKELAVKIGGLIPAGGAPITVGSDAVLSLVEVAFSRWRTGGEKWWAATSGRPTADALLDLHRMVHRGARHERQAAEETLMRAFLADLRHGYSGLRRSTQGGVACVALLDNVHTEAGQTFLDLLAVVRNETPDLVDPLLVIATGARSPRVLQMPPRADPEPLGYPHWHRRWTPEDAGRWFYPIWLRDLTGNETARWVRSQGGYDRGSIAALHRITGGHPQGIAQLLDAGFVADGPGVLDVPDGTGDTLADRVLATLLNGVPEEFRDQLVTCSAGRDLAPATVRTALGESSVHAVDELRRLIADRLWQDPDARPAVLHPWLNRVLLLHLRARPDDHPDSWATVHARLRKACLSGDDRTGARYHALAVHEVEQVVAELVAELPERDPTWLTGLREVTMAPNRLSRTAEPDIRPLVAWTAQADRRTRAVARLVTSLWITSDPHLGTRPALLRAAAYQATELGGLAPWLSDELFALAEEFRRRSGQDER